MQKTIWGFPVASAVALASCGLFGDDTQTSTFFAEAETLLISNPPPESCKKVQMDMFGQGEAFQFGRTEDGKTVSEPGVDEERVFAAIFDRRPDVKEGKIVNFGEGAVWVWHSQMSTDGADPRNGTLHFTDGTSLDNGVPAADSSCGKLKNCRPIVEKIIADRCYQKEDGTYQMKHYFFAVWAWNGDREIAYFSDEPREFCFEFTEAQPCDGAAPADGGTPDGSLTETCARTCGQ
jgi:hypothetical protein